MSSPTDFSFQPSLLDSSVEPSIDTSFRTLERIELDPVSWIDLAPDWVTGSDELFTQIVEARSWGQRSRKMYDKEVIEPRLTDSWGLSSGKPLVPPLLEEMRVVLSERYDVKFETVGFNLYRGGSDSVAWHRDRIPKEVPDPVVALVSVGEPRAFLVRPYGGGPSRKFMAGHGTLLVTGGRAQREWEHSVPKVKSAGPRISVAFRHDMARSKESGTYAAAPSGA